MRHLCGRGVQPLSRSSRGELETDDDDNSLRLVYLTVLLHIIFISRKNSINTRKNATGFQSTALKGKVNPDDPNTFA
jgi:hypothetical protein